MVRFHAFSIFIPTGRLELTPHKKQTSMKRFFTFFVALLSACTFSAYAAIVEGTCGDNLTWTLNTKDSTLTISGTGAMANYESSTLVPWYDYKSYIKYITLPDGLTSLGGEAFSGCSGLTSITIPNSVTNIGNSAFEGCSGLTSVTLGNSVTSIEYYAFYGCSSLTSVTIPNSVTSIGNGAFMWCSGLTSVTIPNSVTSIGNKAFRYCESLTSVTLGSGVTSIGYSAFSKCNKIQEVTAYMPTPIDAKDCGINPAAATLYVPAEYIDTYSNTLWWEDFKEIRAITTTAAPEVFVNPTTPTQKLLRDGQFLILRDGKTYTITGQKL